MLLRTPFADLLLELAGMPCNLIVQWLRTPLTRKSRQIRKLIARGLLASLPFLV